MPSLPTGVRRLAAVAGLLVALGVPASALADIVVARAELTGTRLRVEGRDAVANATITVDGVAMGRADGAGAFRVERDPFSSASCQITVGDGSTSTVATLSGCTATGPGKPIFALRTEFAMVGKPTRWRAQGSTTSSDSLAFVFAWGDDTTLRDPATGFYPADPITHVVDSTTDVSHVYSTAGSLTVTITAVDPQGRSTRSDPHVVQIVADTQSDCGIAGDADDSVEAGRLIPFPVLQCTGRLQGQNGIDVRDVYRFEVGQEFRLLTVSAVGQPNLYDPTGARDFLGRLAPEPIPSFYFGQGGFAWTLEQAGTWKLEIAVAGDLTYTLSLQADQGGDDCVAARSADFAVPPPFDAPNNGFALAVGNAGEVDCSGALPPAGRDRYDSYAFRGDAAVSELVALSVTPAVTDHFCGRRFRLFFGAPEDFPKAYACNQSVFEVGPRSVTRFGLESFAGESSYRIRLATSTRHSGDCFSGADAPASFATAAPLLPACLGDLSATDGEDWYRVPASPGDELALSKRAPVPLEIYDPDGIKRADNAGSVLIDKVGDWRVRTLADKAGFAHFEGVYGLTHFFRNGVAGRDCGTGVDTGVTGLNVTLPVSCQGDFLPFAQDSFGTGELSDRYNFHLDRGETVEITVSAHDPFGETQWTALLDSPSTPTVLREAFGSVPRTITHTAGETGTYSLLLERSPQTNGFELGYSVAISKQAAPSVPRFGISVFAPDEVTRGNVFLVEVRVANTGGPAGNVTLTLGSSPADAVRLTESNFDSFGFNETPTATVNVGAIGSPGEAQFTWAARAEREGAVTLTVTARDGPSGTTSSGTKALTIRK